MSATDYGLIGHPLGHSLSPFIHQSILAAAGLPGSYRLYDIEAAQLPETVRLLSEKLQGFNCTIPYKEAIIPFLDELDATADQIRSVNTVSRGRGFNTDYAAFSSECPLKRENKVLILGAGGVSRTMAFACATVGCDTWIAARRPRQAQDLAAAIRQQHPQASLTCPESLDMWRDRARRQAGQGQPGWILLNGTPVGLWPQTHGLPLPKGDLAWCCRIYDTIYNPVATRLVLAARSRGIPAEGGLGMLFAQALAAQKIWNPGTCFPEPAMKKVRQALARAILRQSPVTILLTGFMGSGKSTAGQILARQLDLAFVDLDDVIEQSAGRTIPDIFATDGEAAFRMLERKALLSELQRTESKVLATGGGALMGDDMDTILQAAPVLVACLNVSMETAVSRIGTGQGRPMLTGRDTVRWEQLYRERLPRYQAVADLVVDAEKPPEEVAATLSKSLGLEE